MNKTASQIIARIFEIAGYLWLVPSLIMLFYALLVLIVCLFAFSPVGVLFSSIPFLLFGFGVFLLVKYRQHSRGLLDDEKILPLWFGTLIFNLLFLLPAIYFFNSIPAPEYIYGERPLIGLW